MAYKWFVYYRMLNVSPRAQSHKAKKIQNKNSLQKSDCIVLQKTNGTEH